MPKARHMPGLCRARLDTAMRITMLKTLARQRDQLTIGETYDVDDDYGQRLIDRGVADETEITINVKVKAEAKTETLDAKASAKPRARKASNQTAAKSDKA